MARVATGIKPGNLDPFFDDDGHCLAGQTLAENMTVAAHHAKDRSLADQSEVKPFEQSIHWAPSRTSERNTDLPSSTFLVSLRPTYFHDNALPDMFDVGDI